MRNLLLLVLVSTIIGGCASNLRKKTCTEPATIQKVTPVISTNPALTNDAVQYFKTLTIPFLELKKANYNYLYTLTRNRNARAVEQKRQELLKIIKSYKEYCQSSQAFQGDSNFKTEAIRYMDMLYIVLKEDFDKILDMEEIQTKSFDESEAHQLAMDLAFDKLKNCFAIFKKAENDFFKKYQITVNREKDELSQKIEKANKALDYYNSLFRIFFKANKEYIYTRDAVTNKDMATLEQHTITLISFSEEGLDKLKGISPFENDNTLLQSAINILEFYIQEGKITFPANIDFTLKADNLQDADIKFKAIKESDRKKEDFDQFNNAVNLYNKAVKDINKINNIAQNKHSNFVKLWNKQMDDFFKKHS